MEPGVPLPTLSRLLRDSDPYELEEPSDEERGQSSSEDEVDVLLHGTPHQKRKLIRECLTGESESSSDDEFEKEMAAELNSTMKALEGSWKSPGTGASSEAGPGSGAGLSGGVQPQFYDEVYFDSDSEDEEQGQTKTKKRRKHKHRILTNDELLYDPQQDDRDQAWVDAQRRGYFNSRRQIPGQPRNSQLQPQTLPNSDAILNCPACMTTLCLDCQRHESYRTQYRAMFVMNCTINKEEVLKYQDALDRRKRRWPKKRSMAETPAKTAEQEIYHPVKCSECSTEVAVYDKEEVYHFFNVIASHC